MTSAFPPPAVVRHTIKCPLCVTWLVMPLVLYFCLRCFALCVLWWARKSCRAVGAGSCSSFVLLHPPPSPQVNQGARRICVMY